MQQVYFHTIKLLMSLLTSPNTTEEQMKFLNKMQRHYHKRGGSQYLPKQRKQFFKFSTKIQSHAIMKIQQLMNQFMGGVRQIVKQFKHTDHYGVLEILRKHAFFSDVAMIISIDLQQKIIELTQQLTKKDEKINYLKKQLNSKTDNEQMQKLNKFNEKSKIKYNPAKSMASNLYYHAKGLSEEQFISFYNKTSLSNNITLKKVQPVNKVSQESDLAIKLSEFIEYGKKCNSEDQIAELVESVKELIDRKKCRKPCCANYIEDKDTRQNKAKNLMYNTASSVSKNQDIYKTDKSEQYFKRYYRGASFNLNEITRVSRTKMQQMERLESQYKRNLKRKKKMEMHGHRYSHSTVRD